MDANTNNTILCILGFISLLSQAVAFPLGKTTKVITHLSKEFYSLACPKPTVVVVVFDQPNPNRRFGDCFGQANAKPAIIHKNSSMAIVRG